MKVSEILSPEVVLVTWLDTTNYEGWFGSEDELPAEPLKMQTLGWLVHKDDAVVVVAMTASELKMGELLVIPAGCICSIDTLPNKSKPPKEAK